MDKSFCKLVVLIVFLIIVDEVYQVKVLDYEMIFFFKEMLYKYMYIGIYMYIKRQIMFEL